MDAASYLRLLQAIDTLKEELLALPRIHRGAITAAAKVALQDLVNEFYNNTRRLRIDDLLKQMEYQPPSGKCNVDIKVKELPQICDRISLLL
jgi:hypothetical protein